MSSSLDPAPCLGPPAGMTPDEANAAAALQPGETVDTRVARLFFSWALTKTNSHLGN